VGNVPNWNDEQWKEAVERLTLHANGKLARLYWRGMSLAKGGSVPGGITPQDLAAEAIEDAIAGRRIWNSATEPDFYRFLRSVVDSKVSHLVECLENQVTRRILVPAEGDDPPAAYEVADKAPDPETVCVNKDSLEEFRSAILAVIQGDTLVEGVFGCLEAELTEPQEMAVILNATVKDINNAQKRLRRKVEQVMKTQREQR
jgi:hypothetical protein